ncbi:MAG: flavodoxin family protein [Spirochaetales bacterium]|nr:flavodoxin family protein [Spirochaetales bacterium]
MKVMVVYDSYFGNTEQVARAIAGELGSDQEVAVVRAGEVDLSGLDRIELLIVGSPTRAFRPSEATTALLKKIAARGLKGTTVAAFDTRIGPTDIKSPILRFFVKAMGYAAPQIAKRLQNSGGNLGVPPEGFAVGGTEGPLKTNELKRAAQWAGRIAAGAS